MTDPLIITVIVIAVAIAFDFVNGFHDAANSIATIVATHVLEPRQAVLWAAFFNFVALFFFSSDVAKTVGSGLIDLHFVTPYVVLAGLLGAVIWGLLTWWWALPTSSSHALIGGYAGAAMGHSWLQGTALAAPVIAAGWQPVLLFIVIAPLLGLVIAQFLMSFTLWLHGRLPEETGDRVFGRLQLLSSAFLSFMHGANDAQKTAGIIAGVLVSAGYRKNFDVPYWVLCLSYFAMSIGTLTGGWRIVKTLGTSLTRLRPAGGFCAETSAALSILVATLMKLPVSTTHVATGAVIGVGMARSPRLVRWGLAANILWAWLFTIPAAALLGAGLIYMIELAQRR